LGQMTAYLCAVKRVSWWRRGYTNPSAMVAGGGLSGEKRSWYQQPDNAGGITGDGKSRLREQGSWGRRQRGTYTTRSCTTEHLCLLASRCNVPASNGGPGDGTKKHN
jgi:hypothetical protein